MAHHEMLEVANLEDFPRIYEIMNNSFPQSEMRDYCGQLSQFDNHHYKVFVKKTNGRIIGFLAVWEFDDVDFIEHFAIDKDYRGNGIGAKMLNEYLTKATRAVFLEVEPPDDDVSIRRIEFYERLGFHLNMFKYHQPALQKGQKSIPLKIMTYPMAVEEDFFLHHKKIVHEVAYSANFD